MSATAYTMPDDALITIKCFELKNRVALTLACGKVAPMQQHLGHIGFVGARKRAVMSEAFAMQCSMSCAGSFAHETPMSRRNDAFTSIYYYRYL